MLAYKIAALPIALRRHAVPTSSKSGWSFNLFVRDLPCLSVDMDWIYLSVQDWTTSLAPVGMALERVAAASDRQHPHDLFDVQELL